MPPAASHVSFDDTASMSPFLSIGNERAYSSSIAQELVDNLFHAQTRDYVSLVGSAFTLILALSNRVRQGQM